MTDGGRLCGGCARRRDCVLQQVGYAVAAGIDIVQIRERDLEARALAALTRDAVALARGTATRLVVNERLDVALAAGADGVHLRGDAMDAAAARSIARPGFLIGRSVHTPAEAADAGDVDYIVAGTVAATTSKPGHGSLLGFDGLAAIVARSAAPVVAIGGMTAAAAPAAARAGARGIAGIGLFMGSTPDASGCRAVPLEEIAAAVRAAFGIT